MKTLSACLIIKNEELVIERCLKSIIPICDEIIVVDTGSNDKTIEIVNNLMKDNKKIKLFHFEWIDDFSVARNFSFEKATSDYLMWVDADEMFTDKLNETILKLKDENFNNYDVIASSVQFYYSENDYSFVFRERILSRNNCPYWRFRVHEELIRNSVKINTIEYIIPIKDGYVFHEKKKESNFNYYFQIYCDSLNKGKLEFEHHNLYYLTWMCSYYDTIMAKLHAYYVFMNLPYIEYEIDYREWFRTNVLNKQEYETLKSLSLLNTYFYCGKNDLYSTVTIKNNVNLHFKFIFNEMNKLYEEKEYFSAYYIINFIISNKIYFDEYEKYEEKLFEYLNIILWNCNLINDFVSFSQKFVEKYPKNKTAIQNSHFSNSIRDKINKTVLIINAENKEWILPHILYITKNYFKQRIVISSKKIDHIVDKDVYVIKDKNNLIIDILLDKDTFYLCVDENSKLDLNIFNTYMKIYYLGNNNFENNIKNVIFTNDKNIVTNFIQNNND